jgi:UDP-N-acetylglucosamine transferase subunit ALG13
LIFITLGSREYQFNRLLKEVDSLLENGKINESVFAQIGQSDYIPRNYTYVKFLSPEEFSSYQNKASLIITHGGTGAIISALKKQKKIIAIPRLSKYKEHTDNHQQQITRMMKKLSYIESLEEISELELKIKTVKAINFKIYDRESKVLEIINEFIANN